MAIEILMPELGESVHEGTVSRWLKKEGDFVKEDEPVVEIMTDKVNTELPSPATGVLAKILIQEGDSVEVFHAMGIIEEQGAATASTPAAKDGPKAEPAKPAAAAPAKAEMPAPPSPNGGERRWYTPVVKAIAKQHSVSEKELAAIVGSGQGGRVTKKDLEAFLASGRGAVVAAPKLEPKPVPPTVAGP
ncbi:MAG: E3 binding domain-containing protein, partial [Fimbriimonas ginsengisoli]|nr:E3 binding domain-containing protein [Fimbriimonas ginsengisoli]